MANSGVIIALFVLVASVASSVIEDEPEAILGQDAHNYFNCPNPRLAKTLLLDEPVSVEGRWFAVQTRTLQFPDSIINDKKITCINIRDLDGNGNGGYPIIVSGGIGQYDVTIHLVTQRGKGMHFRVQIYAA